MVVGTWVCFKSPYKCLPSKIDFRVKKEDILLEKEEKGGTWYLVISFIFYAFLFKIAQKMTKKKEWKIFSEFFWKIKVAKAYNTRYSQAVTHPSTNRARGCLTSVIGRELVHSTRYGRRHLGLFLVPL